MLPVPYEIDGGLLQSLEVDAGFCAEDVNVIGHSLLCDEALW